METSHIPSHAQPTPVQHVSVGLPTAITYDAELYYVRECYTKYYEWVLQLLQKYDYISVTGTPGLSFYTEWMDEGKTELLFV